MNIATGCEATERAAEIRIAVRRAEARRIAEGRPDPRRGASRPRSIEGVRHPAVPGCFATDPTDSSVATRPVHSTDA